MMENTRPLLVLKNIYHRYDGTESVRGFDLTLAPGRLSALLGPSGCGKTTILRIIAGFEVIHRGEVWLRGERAATDSHHIPPQERRVGVVFQDYALFPHLSVADNISFGLRDWRREERAARVREVARVLKIDDLLGRFPHQLSGGQRQRVAVARALAPKPDLILMDEPFSHLDWDLRESLISELRGILKNLGVAVLLVTHHHEEAFLFAEEMGVMQAGRLLQWGPPRELYDAPAVEFVARLMGKGTFLEGAVDNGRILFALGDGGPSALTGSVKVFVRPEDVGVVDAGGLKAQVLDARFFGAFSLVQVRLATGETLWARAASESGVEAGDSVQVRFLRQSATVFPRLGEG